MTFLNLGRLAMRYDSLFKKDSLLRRLRARGANVSLKTGSVRTLTAMIPFIKRVQLGMLYGMSSSNLQAFPIKNVPLPIEIDYSAMEARIKMFGGSDANKN